MKEKTMENITNTYSTSKLLKPKQAPQQFYSLAPDTNFRDRAVTPQTFHPQLEDDEQNEIPVHGQQTHQRLYGKENEEHNQNPHPLAYYSNQSVQSQKEIMLQAQILNKYSSQRPQNGQPKLSVRHNHSEKVMQVHSPQNIQMSNAFGSEKLNPDYEMLINNPQALEFLQGSQINNRNSQPPNLHSNSLNLQHESKKSFNNGIDKKKPIANRKIKEKVSTSNKPSDINAHKKSQSLFNKKIVDIISGLQQSLGVIASNVRNSFNQEELNQMVMSNLLQSNGQKKTLIESALLAQKLAQMTSSITTQMQTQKKKSEEPKKNQYRKSSEEGNSSTQRGYKTIEDSSSEILLNSISNRVSIEGKFNQQKSFSKLNHQRNKSDLSYCYKNGVAPQQNNDNTTYQTLYQGQGQGGMVKSSNTHLTKSIEDQRIQKKPTCVGNSPLLQHQQQPISAKHKKTNQHSNRFKKKPGTSNNSKSNVLANQRSSISSKSKQSGERLSDANFIAKMNRKCNNLLINNGPLNLEQKLKSAASSPTLHGNVKQNLIRKKGMYQGLDLEQQHIQHNNQSKMTLKKKVPDNISSNKQSIQDTFSQHKRSISDGTSLTKMFHFKQQMMINKFLAKGPNTQQHSIQEPTFLNNKQSQNKVTPPISQINSQLTVDHSKVNLVSNLSSKRPSNEAEQIIFQNNYNSPKQQIPQNSKISNSSSRDIYSEMKNFLQKFQQKTVNNVIIPQTKAKSQSKERKNIQENVSGSRVTDIVNGHKYPDKMGKKNVKDKKVKGNYGTQIVNYVHEQNEICEDVKVQYQQKVMNQIHKRAKSDFHNQLDLVKNSKTNEIQESKKQVKQPSNYAPPKQKMYLLNINQQQDPNIQILQQQKTPVIYSARASPVSVKQAYYNFDENSKQRKPSQNMLGPNRSDKNLSSSTSKFTTVLSSLQSLPKPGNMNSLSSNQKQNMVGEFEEYNTLGRSGSNTNRNGKDANEQYQLNYADENMKKILMINNKKMVDTKTQSQLASIATKTLENILQMESVPNKKSQVLIYEDNKTTKDNPKKTFLFSSGDSRDSQTNKALYFDIVSETTGKNQLNIQTINSSPKLKILPTPKAVQPGKNVFLLQSQNSSDHRRLNQENNSFSSNQVKNCERLAPTQQMHSLTNDGMNSERLDTYESNITNNENLSPRTKEKKRLMKLIKISFNKLKEPIKTSADFYKIGKMLGKGAFGRVNLAMHKLCQQLVAVKSINKQFLQDDENSKKKVMQEVLILQKTRHPNIVKLYDSFETNKHIVFVMELCSGGDLLNYVRKRRKLKEDVAKYVFSQVVDGLCYCHAKNIVHRDIKLDNLLLDSDGMVKICDFGVSKLLQDKKEIMTEQCGTPAYIAPEILKDKGYRGFGVDIWSLGVCLYAMLYGTVPFKANNMSELHQLIIKAKYSLKDDKVEISEEAKSLIKSLLEPDPLKRITIDKVKQHPWLEEMYSENNDEFKRSIEIFSDVEIQTIQKDFTYQDMRRYNRNNEKKEQVMEDNQQLSTEHFFTEHALDSTQNALMKNNTTKSIILAPFNSTRSHLPNQSDENGDSILPPLEIEENLIADRKCIKFHPRVKDIDRQYEMNNNCELDNGVYNKFVRQSTQNAGSQKSQDGNLSNENSLMNSLNNDRNPVQAPLVSQNSDEEAEAELMKQNQLQSQSELKQMQSFLLQTQSQIPTIEEQQLLIDYDLVEKVEEFGYPRPYVIHSLENYEMNDSSTSYFLLEKEKLHSFFIKQQDF